MTDLTLEYLRQRLRYCPDTGIFTWLPKPDDNWKNRSWNTFHVGKPAGTLQKTGYIHVTIGKKPFLAHRLAWFYVHGAWPPKFIDHVDRDKGNNRIANLRLATRSQNSANAGLRSDNKSGAKGVFFVKKKKIYEVRVKHHGVIHFIGSFSELSTAASAYDAAAARFFGEFATSSIEVAA